MSRLDQMLEAAPAPAPELGRLLPTEISEPRLMSSLVISDALLEDGLGVVADALAAA